jgi:sterol desaturase/sphingolipid hydroxylase (fatty acid hydroxylase superfamily)
MDIFAALANKLLGLVLAPGSHFSIYALASGLVIGFVYLAVKQKRRRGRVRLRPLARAFFSRRLLLHRSTRADLFYLFVNVYLTMVFIGWACLTAGTVADAVRDALTGAFGARPASALPDLAARAIVTLVGYLAVEWGYWLDHYLKHRIPFLWETHKTHHTAERLTPLTVWRVHPLDSLVFTNIVALSFGAAMGAMRYALGSAETFAFAGANILTVVFFFTFVNLQHSEVWLPLRGLAGRLLMSPAHHQLHHSIDPAHYNSNLGNSLAVFDWIFGTLIVPSRDSPRLKFGVVEPGVDPHSVTALLVSPFVAVARALTPKAAEGILTIQAVTPPMNSAAPRSDEISA